MGRPKMFVERLPPLKVDEGTMARIAPLLNAGEDRSAFIRAAIESEIARRKRASARRD